MMKKKKMMMGGGKTKKMMMGGGKAKEMVDIPIHVPVMDMEASEDAHMIIFHAIKKVFMKKHQ